jgi:hypothetical protein
MVDRQPQKFAMRGDSQKYFSLQPFVQEYKIYTVLQIRYVYPRSQILIFTHPGSRIQFPGSRLQKQQQYRGMKKI